MTVDVENPMLQKDPPSEKIKQYIAAVAVSLGALCAGSVLAWTSPVLPQLIHNETNISAASTSNSTSESTMQLQLTQTQGGIVGSMLALGALVSAIPGGYIADKFGRRKALLSLVIPYMLNWTLIVFATGPGMLYAARFFAGIATGAMCVCAPMYIGEIAEASIRGALGSFFQMFICTGILITYVVGAACDWRMLSTVLALFPIIFALCFYFMPETPNYLLRTKQKESAKRSLSFFRGRAFNVDKELSLIQKGMDEANLKATGFKDLLASKGNKRALISGIGIMALQQFSGINAVIFYTVPIFQSAGSSLQPDIAAIIVGIVQLLFAYVSIMVIERAGRRFFLKLSALGMAVCCAALGVYFHLLSHKISFAGLGTLPLISLMAFIMSFSMGFGPVPWMMLSELFAPEIKGVAGGLAVMTNWIGVFIVTFSFPLMNTYLGGHVTFYIFTIVLVLGTFFVHYVIIETKGKTLQEIQQILNN